ncbi:uncharacterized protein JCM6883_003701 [Sporobolomyces salmoneus]|uniref:uncharacterized protein n=1 Tax=Sporobolomyces salmoneus TaxID=183962 RepID=UPI003180CAFF
MLSSLPPELIRDIIEATVPHTYHSTTYKSRQATLRSLSLVSRQFRDIAQPLLIEIVRTRTVAQLKRLDVAKDEPSGPKELVVKCKNAAARIEDLLDRWKGLQSFTIEYWGFEDSFDLGVLAQHSDLRNVELANGQFECSVFRPFQTLRSLTFDDSALCPELLRLLDPKVLPSLRSVGIKNIDNDAEVVALEAESHLSRLLPQLEAINIQLDLYQLAKNGLFAGYSPRILIDVDYCMLNSAWLQSRPPIHHVRIIKVNGWTPDASKIVLKFIAAARTTETSALESLYLDLSLHPSRVETPDLRLENERIVEECKRGGIEVVFEVQPQNTDKYISEEFWSRQRRRREKEQRTLKIGGKRS